MKNQSAKTQKTKNQSLHRGNKKTEEIKEIKQNIESLQSIIMNNSARQFSNSLEQTFSDPYSFLLTGANDSFDGWTKIVSMYLYMYKTYWEAQKIIDIPVDDALRNRPIASGINQKIIDRIEKKLEELKFWKMLRNAAISERLFGGGLIYIGFEDYKPDITNVDVLKYPIYPQYRLDIEYLRVIPLTRVSNHSVTTNILSPFYTNPIFLDISGDTIHNSRLIILHGEDAINYYDYSMIANGLSVTATNNLSMQRLRCFGASRLDQIWQDILYARRSRGAAARLVETSSTMILMSDAISGNYGSIAAKSQMEELQDMMKNIEINKSLILDSQKVQEIKNLASNFSSIPELIMTYLNVISAASDVPATRFLGTSPGGLNATGDSDLENYYNTIQAYQQHKIIPLIRRMYDYIGHYYYGDAWSELNKNLQLEFPPLWSEDLTQEADRKTKEVQIVQMLQSMGLISDETAIKEINARNILLEQLTEEDIVEAQDENYNDNFADYPDELLDIGKSALGVQDGKEIQEKN